MRAAFADFATACHSAAAVAWSRDLCGPVVLIDRGTRQAFANRPDPDGTFTHSAGVYSGPAPASAPYANTAFAWNGRQWAVIMLPLPERRWSTLALLAHESMHRLQSEQRWDGRDVDNVHLSTETGRLWWRLELRALEFALTTSGPAQRRHLRAAMAFRRERQRQHPGSAAAEDALEFFEGTAEYVGQRIANGAVPLGRLATVDAMRSVERAPSLVRSAAYATGPALGLLLDDVAPGWHTAVRTSRSMAARLAAAIRAPVHALPSDSLAALGAMYGYAGIADEERARAREQRATHARLVTLLVSGPTLTFRQTSASRSFDPNTLIPLDSLGTVYPTGSFEAEWGRLVVSAGGALLSDDGGMIRVSAAGAALADGARGTLGGTGWIVELQDGWTVRTDGRPGSFVISRAP
ncbi:MAG: hypothetical protein IT355_15270 [Gemmatimonadaceae bacterium]|nr:hypothetical protein [Gemmatimonadaceae bacterium]